MYAKMCDGHKQNHLPGWILYQYPYAQARVVDASLHDTGSDGEAVHSVVHCQSPSDCE